jgi:hypothetical protein
MSLPRGAIASVKLGPDGTTLIITGNSPNVAGTAAISRNVAVQQPVRPASAKAPRILATGPASLDIDWAATVPDPAKKEPEEFARDETVLVIATETYFIAQSPPPANQDAAGEALADAGDESATAVSFLTFTWSQVLDIE